MTDLPTHGTCLDCGKDTARQVPVRCFVCADCQPGIAPSDVEAVKAQINGQTASGLLQDLIDDSYAIVDQIQSTQFVPPVQRCIQCEATKGDSEHAHTPYCAVGRAERFLLALA
ncbi:hypothetical protein LCGC14_1098910 [marine sediment metagenome]|uniref:Uncharacterized protein n=1 Tax=marine sediment metagenome TaxID=412755 RepID=A0A0F9QG76_9ZZZZ